MFKNVVVEPIFPTKNWQTEQTLHELKQFSELVGIFLEACGRRLKAVG